MATRLVEKEDEMTQPLSEGSPDPDDLDRMLDELNQEPAGSPAVLGFTEAQVHEDELVAREGRAADVE